MITEARQTENILEVSHLSLGYGGSLGAPPVLALKDINFQIREGEFLGIVGPNGSGKSTLLKGILGRLPVLEGEIRYRQVPVRKMQQLRKAIGYVPQKNKNDTHFPALVKEVTLMGLYAQIGWFHRPQKIHFEKAMHALEMVGMADFSERAIGSLSGGQQQRVMIARALAADPDLLILDEPTASVDVSAQNMILELLEKLNREQKMTILMVSHDINEMVHVCHKILLLGGSGSRFGTPSEVLTKENLKMIYGDRIYVYNHDGHPHILVGDFRE